jgi:hypothetical protein
MAHQRVEDGVRAFQGNFAKDAGFQQETIRDCLRVISDGDGELERNDPAFMPG